MGSFFYFLSIHHHCNFFADELYIKYMDNIYHVDDFPRDQAVAYDH